MKKTNSKNRDNKEKNEFIEKVIKINRVNKVVKGGKRLAFRAVVVVGDEKGQVALGLGKSREVPVAIRKGIERAKKDFVKVHILNGTVPHDIEGIYGSSKVLIRQAKAGTGVIAGGAVRAILEAVGLKDVVAKSKGKSTNVINTARATLNGLTKLKIYEQEVEKRGVKFSVNERSRKEITQK